LSISGSFTDLNKINAKHDPKYKKNVRKRQIKKNVKLCTPSPNARKKANMTGLIGAKKASGLGIFSRKVLMRSIVMFFRYV
jgi:hypothetical protein